MRWHLLCGSISHTCKNRYDENDCSQIFAVIFNVLGWAMNKRGFALTGAILYTVALVLMPLYFMFVIIQMILSYVGFAKLKTIIADNTAQTANTQSGNEM